MYEIIALNSPIEPFIMNPIFTFNIFSFPIFDTYLWFKYHNNSTLNYQQINSPWWQNMDPYHIPRYYDFDTAALGSMDSISEYPIFLSRYVPESIVHMISILDIHIFLMCLMAKVLRSGYWKGISKAVSITSAINGF